MAETADDREWDAIVIGGGPSGASVAGYLAREGRRVLALERERFPREHVGESLLPGVLPYLDALGVRAEVERAGFERKEGQTFFWGGDRAPWEIDFRELDVHPYSYFVDRGKFDQILLNHAARAGASVREGCAARKVLFENGRAVGVEFREESGNHRVERAKFVVDATGQSSLVARGADLHRPVRGLKNLAFWAYWNGTGRLPGHKATHILTVSIPDGWIWMIPLAGGRMSVGIVTSSRASREVRQRMGAEAWYESVLRADPEAWKLLACATRETGVRSGRDWSYRARRFSGPGILLCGDSACFIDPILSTGVHLAMTSAYWAAACVHSSLATPRHEPILRRFYDETYAALYRDLLSQVKAFYRTGVRQDSIYWASKQVLRVGNAVEGNRAFLFIAAGLLRNAATAAPLDPLATARVELGPRAVSPAVTAPEPPRRARDRIVSPPMVWRVGNAGGTQLVTVRSSGLTLSVVPHEPRGVTDQPARSFVALEFHDGARLPLALGLVTEALGTRGPSAPRLRVSLIPYPVRPHDRATLDALERSLREHVARADNRAGRVSIRDTRRALLKSLAVAGALPDGVGLTRPRELRGGSVAETPLTGVFETQSRSAPAARVYLTLEARVPPELTDVPVLRTRFLDLWVQPERGRDGRPLRDDPDTASLLDGACARLWVALADAPSRAAAFARAEAALAAPGFAPAGFSLLALGRLGATGRQDADRAAG